MIGKVTSHNSHAKTNFFKFIRDPYGFVKMNPTSGYRYLLVFIGWVFQGILYADETEKCFKIIFDLGLTFSIFFITVNLMNTINLAIALVLSFLVAHTINWLLNVGIWCSLRGKYGMHVDGVGTTDLQCYAINMQKRIHSERSVMAAAIYGSVARGEAKETSDLDVRIIRRPGICNGIRACSFGLLERFRALICKIPLDLCVIDSTDHLAKLRTDECPLIMHDPARIFPRVYNEVNYLDLEESRLFE
jgi:predicted nucleotidyltransferase